MTVYELEFDWGNCDSVAHESQRNSLLNALVADISDRSPRPGGGSPTLQGIRARFRRRYAASQYAEILLNQAATTLQRRCSSPLTGSPRRGSSSGGTSPRHVSLMFWPPEFIPPSCWGRGAEGGGAGRRRRGSVLVAAREVRLVAALLLEARKQEIKRGHAAAAPRRSFLPSARPFSPLASACSSPLASARSSPLASARSSPRSATHPALSPTLSAASTEDDILNGGEADSKPLEEAQTGEEEASCFAKRRILFSQELDWMPHLGP
ncbi:hypothetical protein T484DRAFT_1839765 [Baffinella frigidus]|nr:hypothetical protein T484DRAFT_1839765 [Cryptophyta sp. CCMP2293]